MKTREERGGGREEGDERRRRRKEDKVKNHQRFILEGLWCGGDKCRTGWNLSIVVFSFACYSKTLCRPLVYIDPSVCFCSKQSIKIDAYRIS